MLTPIRMKLIQTLETVKIRVLGILVSLATVFGLLDAPETRAAGSTSEIRIRFRRRRLFAPLVDESST